MIFDGKLYLNLEKQVQKNKEDIEYMINEEGALNQFGLRVIGQVETIGDMPTIQAYKQSNPKWEYGDAFMVGVSTEEAAVVDVDNAALLVLTRANTVYPNDFWMNLGKFPKPGPVGPKGEQGEQGIQGEHGLDVTSGTGVPTRQAPQGTTYINATTGDVYKYTNGWELIGNIKGATGSVGPAGPQGKTGSIGPTGEQGPQGPRGIGVNILGTLTSTSQLPNPTTVAKDSAYIIPADGVNHLWVIEGTDNLVWTDFGTAGLGEKGDKGDAGVGINTMTDLDLTYGNATVEYNTTDGININGQARFTYDGGTTKDVTMDIEVPIVSEYGITMDKKADEEKVEIGLDFDRLRTEQFLSVRNVIGKSGVIVMPTTSSEEPVCKPVLYGDGENFPSYTDYEGLLGYTTSQQYADGYENEEEIHYVNIGYANKHYAPLLTSDNAGYPYFYTVYGTNAPSLTGGSLVANPTTVAIRGEGGRLQVGTPVGVNDATTKAYVDGLHHYSHHIVIGDGTSEIFITLAIKNYPNAVTTLDGATELVGALTDGLQPIMATGVVDGHNISAVLVQADQKMYVRFYDSTTSAIKTAKVEELLSGTVTVHDIVA